MREQEKPFESAAAELVSESEHPLKQLQLLDATARQLARLGDADAVIECRIKQLSLQKVLVHLYEFPTKELVGAQTTLAQAYASGGYHKQAQEHLERAREICRGGIHDDVQSQRLEVDILLAQGAAHFEALRPEAAERMLTEAVRSARQVFGDSTARSSRARGLLGQIAYRSERYSLAVEHFREAVRVHEVVDDPDSEETMRARVLLAEALYATGAQDEALDEQRVTIACLRQTGSSPDMLVSALSQLARWLESQGRESDSIALDLLKEAERILDEQRDPKAATGAVLAEAAAAAAGPTDTVPAENDVRARLREVLEERLRAEGDGESQERLAELRNEERELQRVIEESRVPVTKAVEVSRDIALLHLKIGNHDAALDYLLRCEYLERWLHGSQSTNVGRILKALGTVHLAMQNIDRAESCLLQALRIFEADLPPNEGVIRDIRAKLNSIAAASGN